MIGTITICDFKVHAMLGVYPEERRKLQEISVDLMFKIDISKCVVSDSLEDTVNYEIVSQIVYDVFSQKHYFLLEKFAYELACQLFARFPLLFFKVEIKKRGAIALACYASVTVELTKEEFLCLGS